jgi:hypothetical protein
MAKLTDIPVVTTLDAADLIYAVDVSDTTDDPAGTSVAITKANLGGGPVTIATITNASGAGSDFHFTSLDLTPYSRVYVKGNVRGTNAATGSGLFLYINGDVTPANYISQYGYNTTSGNVGGWASSADICQNTSLPGATSPTDSYGSVVVEIENPGGTTYLKSYLCHVGAFRDTSLPMICDGYVSHRTIKAAITHLQVLNANGASCEGTLSLIGEV